LATKGPGIEDNSGISLSLIFTLIGAGNAAIAIFFPGGVYKGGGVSGGDLPSEKRVRGEAMRQHKDRSACSFASLQHVCSSFPSIDANQKNKPVRPVPAKKTLL